MTAVFIGTAGWGVPREQAALHASTGTGTGLQRYASVLGAAEINSTFYRRHRPATFERWRDSVPASFRFAVKLPRTITHEAALVSPRADLRTFFEDIRGLGEKLGPILVQLPASLDFDTRKVAAFFRTLRSMHSGPVACEPRNAGWYSEAAAAIFAEHDIARVEADPPRPAGARAPASASSLRYVRWHGSPRVYWSAYGEERLSALRDSVRQTSAGVTTWCIFDNTASGAAFGDALRLRELLGEPRARARGS